jgi:hypothetical protein
MAEIDREVGLVVGKRYRNPDRDLISIVAELHEANIPEHLPNLIDYPFLGYNQTRGRWCSYTAVGHYNQYETSDEDLVEETEDLA